MLLSGLCECNCKPWWIIVSRLYSRTWSCAFRCIIKACNVKKICNNIDWLLSTVSEPSWMSKYHLSVCWEEKWRTSLGYHLAHSSPPRLGLCSVYMKRWEDISAICLQCQCEGLYYYNIKYHHRDLKKFFPPINTISASNIPPALRPLTNWYWQPGQLGQAADSVWLHGWC